MKTNWFNTLNEALASEGLIHLWPMLLNIRYGESAAAAVDGTFMSVYRDERGMYERPTHYKTQMENTSH